MLSGLLFLSLILISCSGNDPELNAAPEAVVELSDYAGTPVDMGLSVYWTASRATSGDWEGAAMALYCDQFSLNSKASPCHEANAGRIRPVCDKTSK